jgi:zinc transport system permease protein
MSESFFSELISFWQYGFVQKAFVAGAFVSVTCALLGTFLVLRKMSLIGDGLSHVSFGAVALGLFLGATPLYVAVPVVMASSIFILALSKRANIYGDAAIGIVSAVGIASGVLLASLSRGFNVDLFSYLFGSILAISMAEVWFSVGLSLVVLFVLFLFYWDLFSATFDEEYAKTTGIRTGFIDTMLALLTALTVVLSIKVVGVMLVSALLILPAVAALQVARGFTKTLIFAGGFAFLSVLIGITISFFFDLPAGATIVLLLGICFGLAFAYKKSR